MTDPLDDRLHSALKEAGAGWNPVEPPATVRARLLYRLRSGHRRSWFEFLVPATLVLLAFTALVIRRTGEPTQPADPGSPASIEQRGAVGGPAGTGASPSSTTSAQAGSGQAPSPKPKPSLGQAVSPPAAGRVPSPVPTPSPAGSPRGSGAIAPVPPSPQPSRTPDQQPVTTSNESSSSSGIEGRVLFSPVCPVERFPPDPACAPRPGAASISVVRTDGSIAAQEQAGDDGRFRINVAPGRYLLRAKPPGNAAIGGCEEQQVQVRADAFTAIDISCDTGIR